MTILTFKLPVSEDKLQLLLSSLLAQNLEVDVPDLNKSPDSDRSKRSNH